MENTRKIKWRLNVFDIVIIVLALAAAALVYRLSLSGTGTGVVPSGSQETVRYTIELSGMVNDTAYMIKPGDSIMDKIERRAIGSVVSVEVRPYRPSTLDQINGKQIITEHPPQKKTAIVVIEATASVTDSEISVNGYVVRVGMETSVMGPLYAGSGFIIDIERGGTK